MKLISPVAGILVVILSLCCGSVAEAASQFRITVTPIAADMTADDDVVVLRVKVKNTGKKCKASLRPGGIYGFATDADGNRSVSYLPVGFRSGFPLGKKTYRRGQTRTFTVRVPVANGRFYTLNPFSAEKTPGTYSSSIGFFVVKGRKGSVARSNSFDLYVLPGGSA